MSLPPSCFGPGVPLGRQKAVVRLSRSLECVCVAGVGFQASLESHTTHIFNVRRCAVQAPPQHTTREESDEETRDHVGICFYFRWGGSDCGVCPALPRGKRTLRVRGHKYQLAILAGGAGGVFGRVQSPRRKGGTDW